MVVEDKSRPATNDIFGNVVVYYSPQKYRFSQLRIRHFISATKICYWRISICYRAPSFCPKN